MISVFHLTVTLSELRVWYMSQIWPWYVPDRSHICSRHVQEISQSCYGHAQICSRHLPDMSKTCPRYIQEIFQICPRYALSMSHIFPRYISDMTKICLKYVRHRHYKYTFFFYTRINFGNNILPKKVRKTWQNVFTHKKVDNILLY